MLCVAMCILAVTKWKGYFPVKWKEAHEDFIFVMLDWPARGDPVIKWNLTYQSSVYAHHNISMCIKELLSLTLIGFPVVQLVEHGASNAKIMGSIPRESKSW